MASIDVPLTADDEGLHVLPDDWLSRESHYFGFWDAKEKLWVTVYAGIRPQQNYAEGFSFVLLAEHRVLLYRIRLPLEGETGLFKMGGLQLETVKPLEEWRIQTCGDFMAADPYALTTAPAALPETVPVQLDFNFQGVGPAYEYPPEPFVRLSGNARHYEQAGHTVGRLVLGDQTYAIDGFGVRDHSWGVRDWTKAGNALVVYAQFGSHFTVNALWGMDGDESLSTGYVWKDGRNISVVKFSVEIERDPDSKFPTLVQGFVTLEDGQEFLILARPLVVLPIVMSQDKFRLFWYECFSHFTCGDETGYGVFQIAQKG